MPPFDSRIRSYSLGATCFEPLNIMCSKKCEMPVMPGASLREPTRYHCQNAMVGTLWSSCVSTTRPFGSVWRSTGRRSGVTAASVAASGAPAAANPRPTSAAASTAERMGPPVERWWMTRAGGAV